jgi:PEP-CTERM motif
MLNEYRDRANTPFAVALLALGMVILGSSAHGGSIVFNPTGTAGDPVYSIGGIDPGPGNALAVGALPLAVGKTFQLDYQASVSDLISTNGLPLAAPGLTSSYQLTTVGSFTEIVTSLNSTGTLATFAVAPNQSPNSFFQMYYNPAVVAINLTGTGFNAGTLILSGKPSTTAPSIGIFSLSTTSSGSPVITQFDQFLSNHYPQVSSVAGSGSAMLSADVTYFDPAFFKTPVSRITFNASLVTPFEQVNPSALFNGLPGGGAPNVIPQLGTVNGFNGQDFQFQVDSNLSFTRSSVPEPASIILAGIGLLGVLGLAAWTRRNKKQSFAPASLD